MPIRNLNEEVLKWNAKYPVGTSVDVILGSGTQMRMKTRTEARVLNGRKAVVWLAGVRNPFDLSMIRPLKRR